MTLSENSIPKRLIERLTKIEAKYAELEKEYRRRCGKRRKAVFDELIRLRKKWKSVKRQLHDHFKPIILKRDNYRCRVCGSSENLELTRLYEDSLTLLNASSEEQELIRYSGPYRTVEERYASENMFILCKRCHRRFDSFAGRLWRMGPKAVSSVEEAVCILRNRDLFDKPPFLENHMRKYRESMVCRGFLTMFKVLRKASLFNGKGDAKKSRFYLGLVKREWRFLSGKVSDDLCMKIDSLIKKLHSVVANKNMRKIEADLRKTIMEYLEGNLEPVCMSEFKRAVFEQDKLLEKKFLSKKLK
ncbi:MAG: hypothetical protein QXQ41_03515 [Candidatus Bathyarchaeia archaeon]